MPFLKTIKNYLSTPSEQPSQAPEDKPIHKRSFVASSINRMLGDFTQSASITVDLKEGLQVLRNRSRGLSINNEFTRRYLKLIKTNIVGPDGVQIALQATHDTNKNQPDFANDLIENHFSVWGRPENCTVTGKIDWRKTQELVLESVARDGESLVLFHRGPQFGPYNFQIQILEAEHLDEFYNTVLQNGNVVVQGVELNAYGRPVAYHIWQRNPTDYTNTAVTQNKRIRIEAGDILHVYNIERASQERGFPWTVASMEGLHQVKKYREATLIAAREAANKMIFFKQNDNVDFTDDEEPDDAGNITLESTPGQHQILPRSWDVQHVDFNQPTTTFGDYQKNVVRPLAAGMGVSYNSLSGDLESVNYSSARFGGLEDHAQYRSDQQWFINAFVRPVYEEWLKMQLITDSWNLAIPLSKFQKFANVDYRARTWQSVDPLKDLNADLGAVAANITSVSDVIRKSGRDPDAVFAQIAKDKAKMEQLGITPTDILKTLAEINQIEANNAGANISAESSQKT